MSRARETNLTFLVTYLSSLRPEICPILFEIISLVTFYTIFASFYFTLFQYFYAI